MTASGRSFSIDAKALSNSSGLLILTGLIVVPVASPPSFICSRKGLEKGSVALARAVTANWNGRLTAELAGKTVTNRGLHYIARFYYRNQSSVAEAQMIHATVA
jgi:hypothetical protein